MTPRVILVDECADIRTFYEDALSSAGFDVLIYDDTKALSRPYASRIEVLLVTGLTVPPFEGMGSVRGVILATTEEETSRTVRKTINFLRLHGIPYVLLQKPFSPQRLILAVETLANG